MATTFVDAQVGSGLSDPGVDPITGQPANPVTDAVYSRLPEMYRQADALDRTTTYGWPLYGWLDAIASPLVEPLRIADLIADGMLTDPAAAPDEWIPWMAQALGVGGVGLGEQRFRLTNLVTAPPLGSRHYIEVLVQSFLLGTKSAQVTAVAPWGIRIRVRADEIPGDGTTDHLAALLYATGLIPAGFALQVITDQETWGQIQVVLPTWAQGEGKSWAKLESIGLAGSGFATGGVSWVGHAAG